MKTRLLKLALPLACLLAFSGCAYELGSTLPPDLKTIYVPTFVNKSGEPQLEIQTTAETIREFQTEGNLKVVESESMADLTLKVTLREMRLDPLRYQKDSPKSAAEYRMLIYADVELKRNSTGKSMMKLAVSGQNSFLFSGDMASSKLAALPKTSRDLAHSIVGSIVEYW